jgi:pilus assembly protein CpaB
MNNKRRVIGIVGATVLATIGTAALVGYVRSAKEKAISDETLVDVYIVDELVPRGAGPSAIKSSVSLEKVPARLKQRGAITDLDDVGENVAAADMQPGDQLVVARLAAEEEVATAGDGLVEISVLLDAERAVGGMLTRGDLVGVYLSFDPFELDAAGDVGRTEPEPTEVSGDAGAPPTTDDDPSQSPNVSRLEFQHVLVTNVQTINEPVALEDEADASVAQVTGTQYVVTLALSPEQSERFVFATEFGHIWLSIEPATTDDDGTRPVTLGEVYKAVN